MEDYTILNLESVFEAYDKGTIVPAQIGSVSGDGHQMLVFGVPAFLPKSQEGGNLIQEGNVVDVCVIKIIPADNLVIVSAKATGRTNVAGTGTSSL